MYTSGFIINKKKIRLPIFTSNNAYRLESTDDLDRIRQKGAKYVT